MNQPEYTVVTHADRLRTLISVIRQTDEFIANYDNMRVLGLMGISDSPLAGAAQFNSVSSQKAFELSRATIHGMMHEIGGLTLRHTDASGEERKVVVFGFEGRSLADPSLLMWQEGERQQDGVHLGGKVALQASLLSDEARLFEDNL